MARSKRLLWNLSRGGGKIHSHRREIVRKILGGSDTEWESLPEFLTLNFFRLPESWSVFEFDIKDWRLCERLLATRHAEIDAQMLGLVRAYAETNQDAVSRLYDLSSRISSRILSRDASELAPLTEEMTKADAQSLFGLRLECATNSAATDVMLMRLEHRLRRGWARARLIHPMVYHYSNTPQASALDTFLSYIVTGKEHDAEKLALKLMLSDEAARDTSLAFKCFIGLMGHPFDAIEFVLDHVEYEVASGRPLSQELRYFIIALADAQPASRAPMMAAALQGQIDFIEGARTEGLAKRFDISPEEAERYANLCTLEPVIGEVDRGATRPFDILSNMRIEEYPDPFEFQTVTAERAVWHFIDAGRFIGSLLRSIYMIERATTDLEVRDCFRLIMYLGFVNAFIATMPSAITMLRKLGSLDIAGATVAQMEVATNAEVTAREPFPDRLWINALQWRLRQLEERGRIQEWLRVVREKTKLRPAYLTGINWHWVEGIISEQRLKPFKSTDGVYLFILMDLETNSDPLRLRLTLDPILRGKEFSDAVELIISEFGKAAPALVRRYFTTQNLLVSGLAPNYLAALDQRVLAMERCIRTFGFGLLLTEDVYESEVRALTAELLLTDVNAGKFEVPWDTFRKDANETHEDLHLAVESLRSRLDEIGPLTSIVDTPITFPNGRSQTYRVRHRDHALFALIIAILEGFMQHPAFGIEVILSGRFRHNNLLQEYWSAIADVVNATIESVTRRMREKLSEDYKRATEKFLDEWCSARLQSERIEKPYGLFNLVPSQSEVEALIAEARQTKGVNAVTDVVIEWIKTRLRGQIKDAREAFTTEVVAGLSGVFIEVRKMQTNSGSFRETDIQRVHNAINDAVLRRTSDLRSWFDGLDTETSGPITLNQLSFAAEALFENMIAGASLKIELNHDIGLISFEAQHVKIAFDMLRELYYNALTHGSGPKVTVRVERDRILPDAVSFTNLTGERHGEKTNVREVEGHVYRGLNEAVTREGNSGLAKIAASSATLAGRDIRLTCRHRGADFQVVVVLRREALP